MCVCIILCVYVCFVWLHVLFSFEVLMCEQGSVQLTAVCACVCVCVCVLVSVGVITCVCTVSFFTVFNCVCVCDREREHFTSHVAFFNLYPPLYFINCLLVALRVFGKHHCSTAKPPPNKA